MKELIKSYKENFNDGQSYCDCWDEGEYRLYAYMDSEWNVDISYKKEEIRTRKEEDGKTMKKYTVYLHYNTLYQATVEAENEEEAAEKAREYADYEDNPQAAEEILQSLYENYCDVIELK